MGQIQSSIGLITGVPIAETVEQLISISAQPRDNLVQRTGQLQQEQIAVTELTAKVIGVQFAAERLSGETIFDKQNVTSSQSSLLSAAITGSPPNGDFRYTPVARANTHQLLSDGLAASDEPLGAGRLSFRFGGHVDPSAALDDLNGGAGIERGKIRITDRSGSSAVVDLRFVRTVDDVVRQINLAEATNVEAVADGDAIRLIDRTGQSVSNLLVQEVGLGSTAASLGLGGIDVAADEALGQDVYRLHASRKLASLNDGNGLNIRSGLPDLELTFRDNSAALQIDFTGDEETLGDLLDAINAADPARVSAAISADGDRIELTDLTTDAGGTFAVTSPLGGTLAEDLGLTGAAAGAVLSGKRLQAGLKSTLIQSLAGGSGLQLGTIDLTDRSGATASVDLSAAETLEDVIDLVNAAGLGIQASVNDARNGLLLTDTTGATASNLIVANGDATNAADQLKIAVDAAQTAVDSGSLDRQVVGRATRLSELNYGRGVALGSIQITDADGTIGSLSLITSGVETVGDILDAINGLGIGVSAQLNDAGDGILLVDTTGNGTFVVNEVGGTAAADLGILGSSTEVDLQGTPTHVIEASTTVHIDIDADDTLQDLVDKINETGAVVTASVFNAGTGDNPFRLSLVSQESGSRGALVVDASQLGLGFREVAAAADALLLVGDPDAPGAGFLAASSDNVFDSVLDGVSLTVNEASDEPVSINVATSDTALLGAVQLFVDQYNSLRTTLEQFTFFNETDKTTGVLFGSAETLRVDADLSRLLSGRFSGVGSVRSLGQLGIRFTDTGQLEFNADDFSEFYAGNSADVERFFRDENLGFAKRVDDLIETLAGEDNSLLVNRANSLQSKIDSNTDRVEFMTQRLDAERERLLKQFFELETIVGRLQSNLGVISGLQPLPPLTSGSS